MRIVKVSAVAAGIGILCFMSSWSLFQIPAQNQFSSDQSQKKAFDAYKMQNTLDFLNKHAPDIDLTTDIGKKRLEFLIEQYTESDAPDELILLYEAFPSAFDYKELPSLAVANAYLASHQTANYYTVRNEWKGHEREFEKWFFLDAEALTKDHKFQEASELLNSRSFKGEAETDRLIRLALLFIVEDPKLSWKYLSEASFKDPENSSLNTYKAHLLEAVNKYDMALSEYIYAVQKDPENPQMRENLADFYFRTHQYNSAIQVLADSLSSPSSDSIWLKALFLNNVISPIKYNWNQDTVPTGETTDLVNYLKELPPGIFWNSATFDRLPHATHYLNNQQETFWLRLLMALKNNKDNEALELLQQNHFQTISWMPELECQIKTALTYRQAYQQSLSFNDQADAAKQLSDHTTINQESCLDTLKIISKVTPDNILSVDMPKNLQDLIQSKEIFAILFLAAGWDEAALQLHSLAVIPSELPEWVASRLTEAIERNRGSSQALQFALNQKASTEINLLIARLAIKGKQQEVAIDRLKALYKNKNDAGLTAARQLSTLYFEQGDYAKAKDVILAQPTLASESSTKEILAKIALQSGDIASANSLYLELENESFEAKAFLARKAFADKDWKRARALTEVLIKQYPNNAVIKDNLHNILLEEQKESLTKRR